jgi:hypothetical protein
MILKFKGLALALVAVVVMSLAIAFTASAGQFTSSGKVKLTATESAVVFKLFGFQLVCEAHYDIGGVSETPHGLIPSNVTTFTVKPGYKTCSWFIGETKAPATVTMNGCDTVIHLGAIIGAGPKYNLVTDIACPAGKEIEMHAYTSAAHSSVICTVKVSAQTGLINGTAETSGSNLKLGGPVKGIKATKTGILCGGSAETTAGEVVISTEVTGTNEAGAATAVSVSGS